MSTGIWSLAAVLAMAIVSLALADERARVRELGIEPGILPPGPLNAITDVEGVCVGHTTLIEGDDVRTGVTAILPHDGNLFQRKVRAAAYVGNGFGKAAGFLQVQELGNIETPIILTNTLSVAAGIEGAVKWTLDRPGNENVRSVNAVVGETNDGGLNDIRGMHVKPEHVVQAIEAAEPGPVEEGAVGAGTGTRCFGFKGGIGTSSRKVPDALGGYTVGALVQSNFGGVLTVDGRKVGEELGQYPYRGALESQAATKEGADSEEAHSGGSCMIVIATDAPLSSRNLERLAKRAVLGLARTGSYMSNGSGDFVLAFSVAERIDAASQSTWQPRVSLRNDRMSPLFLACVEAVEEAIYNSLTMAQTTRGNGRTVDALPLDALR